MASPDLPTSCVAAVARLVLVGRGGLRLHEEVFFTGIRLHQGGVGMAEEKVDAILDSVLDGEELRLAEPDVREHLAQRWNADGSRLRERLDAAMHQRSATKQRAVADRLAARETADVERARAVFARFRDNLRDSLRRLDEQDKAGTEVFDLFDDERRQRARDVARMQDRLRQLDDDETREVDGLRQRYTDVKPYVSAAALVFALTEADARAWGEAR